MMIEAQKIINLPVAAEDSLSKIGQIHEIIVDPENGQILGFLVKAGGLFSQDKVLSAMDVQAWDPNGIVTGSVENLVDLEEIIRIKDLVNRNIIILGMKAETESGKALGTVENFLIDTDTQTITKYYLKDLFGKALILAFDKVIKIDKKIIFSEDVTGGETAQAMKMMMV